MNNPVRQPELIKLSDGREVWGIEQDYEIAKEDWNDYRLADGGRVRVRISAERIFRIVDKDGKPLFQANGEPEVVVRHNVQIVASNG
jgi:hypothetical protein